MNEMNEMNENFRYLPLSLLRRKKDGKLFLLQYDYTYAHGVWNEGCNYRDISLFHLDDSGEITDCSSWHDALEFESVGLPKIEYLDKVCRYHERIYGPVLR